MTRLIVTAAMCVALSSQVHAALVSSDLALSGDGLLTRDTVSGLEWLDVTATRNRSVNDILGGDGGWIASGFRYASREEFDAMLASVGLSEGPSTSAAQFAAGQDVLLKLGFTYTNNEPSPGAPFGQRTLYGVLADDFPPWSNPARYYVSMSASDNYLDINSSGQWFLTSQSGAVGSFLVRSTVSTVPEPGTTAFFLAGFLLLALARRGRGASSKCRAPGADQRLKTSPEANGR